MENEVIKALVNVPLAIVIVYQLWIFKHMVDGALTIMQVALTQQSEIISQIVEKIDR